jgi:hypothetical protein
MDEWENWETVSIEAELDKLRDERTENESQLTPSQTRCASSSNSIWRILLGLLIGLTILIMVCLLLIK